MKTLQIQEPGRAVWKEVPTPQPAAGEVLVRVEAVATCPHWDLHLLSGQPMFAGATLEYPYLPGQPGHEAVGAVASLGEGVTEFAVGDRVAVWRDSGKRPQGCYAHYNNLRAADVLRVPPELPREKLVSLELAMCVEVSFQQLDRLGGVVGRRVGLSGLGPAGLVAVQLARARGAAEVIGIDPVPARRSVAEKLGAHRTVAPDTVAWPASRRENALDVSIDLTGVPSSIEFLMDRTRECVTLFGVLRDEVRFSSAHLFGPGLALMGYGEHNRAAAVAALQWIESGALDLSPLITVTLPFSRYADGVALLRSKSAIKVLFDPWLE